MKCKVSISLKFVNYNLDYKENREDFYALPKTQNKRKSMNKLRLESHL